MTTNWSGACIGWDKLCKTDRSEAVKHCLYPAINRCARCQAALCGMHGVPIKPTKRLPDIIVVFLCHLCYKARLSRRYKAQKRKRLCKFRH